MVDLQSPDEEGGLMANAFTDAVCALISSIPYGRVASYGMVAKAAGSPRGARQVARILHTQSEKRNLPWHRVVGAGGRVLIGHPEGAEMQRRILESEGVEFDGNGNISKDFFHWEFIVAEVD